MRADPSRHLPTDALERQLHALRPPPRGEGMLRLVVARGPNGRHTPKPGRFTRAAGLEGDRWATREDRAQVCQISVMRADVSSVLGGGQDLTLSGDNLLVDLDLHVDALPAGTRLRIGTAVFEVTPEKHTGCRLFRDRYGIDALRLTNLPRWRDHRLRGVYFEVIEDGEASPGDPIEFL